MSGKIICDGCGAEVRAIPMRSGGYLSPNSWFGRGDDDGNQDACSRACVDVIAEKTRKTKVIIPI